MKLQAEWEKTGCEDHLLDHGTVEIMAKSAEWFAVPANNMVK